MGPVFSVSKQVKTQAHVDGRSVLFGGSKFLGPGKHLVNLGR